MILIFFFFNEDISVTNKEKIMKCSGGVRTENTFCQDFPEKSIKV